MMGTALCWPLADNGHTIRLVGTHLDEEIISSIKANRIHPKLQRRVPDIVQPFTHQQIVEALDCCDVVVSGVSSFGVHWFSDTVGPLLRPGVPVIAVTKGLEDQEDGSLLVFPQVTRRRLPAGHRDQISLNAIGGPCTSHELAARRQTCVVFCGNLPGDLETLKGIFATDYYHVWNSQDIIGVEVCAALKNAYALGVGLAVGMMEKAGPDGLALAYNPQAALFAQACYEMRCLVKFTGGGEDNAVWLPGAGDLYVTIYGGRTVRMGKLLGQGLSYPQARKILAGETLESIEIIRCMGRAIPKLASRNLLNLQDFPLLMHLHDIIKQGQAVRIPWDTFFGSQIKKTGSG